MLKKQTALSFFAAIAIAIFAIGINAQSGTSSIGGSVVDEQGKALPGATVILKSTAQNTQRTTTTDNDGAYD